MTRGQLRALAVLSMVGALIVGARGQEIGSALLGVHSLWCLRLAVEGGT